MTTYAFERLIADLDAAVAMAPEALGGAVKSALSGALSCGDWLAGEARRAHPERYARHFLHADPHDRYALLAIAWGPGQRSPVHGHYCWCAVGVYAGELTETYYRDEGVERPAAKTEQVRRRPGDISFDSPLAGIHSIGNCSNDVAVSLHVYGVARERIATGVNRIIELPKQQPLQPRASNDGDARQRRARR